MTKDEVVALYRCILHREPENEAVILSHMQNSSFSDLRASFQASEEAEISRIKSGITSPVYFQSDHQIADRPKLAVAAIVKNEVTRVEKMLRSCIPVAAFFSIFDTGSNDGTPFLCEQILQKIGMPHIIRQGEFVDFASARNNAIAMIPESLDWILMLDADEYLVPEDYASLHNLLYRKECDGWQLPRYNFVDSKMKLPVANYPDYQRRLIKNRSDIKYFRPVHEAVRGVRRWGYATPNYVAQGGLPGGPHIHHVGLIDIPSDRQQAKNEFYASLSR